MNKKIAINLNQKGQSLIETLVAIFILTAGLISGVGLAIYSFNSTDNASKQVVGTALAREGVEIFQNIRDTNWLDDDVENCSNLGEGQECHTDWLNGSAGRIREGDFAVRYVTGGAWQILQPPTYTLYRFNSTGLFTTSAGVNVSETIYSRRIRVSFETTGIYSQNNPKVVVLSEVWWHGRNCPKASVPDALPQSCKVSLQLNLTNWKNY
jgi:hypothetical protein